MAFRIEESVVRGEIDNRVKGIVRGKIWLEGRDEPLVLELTGNAWPDLASCLLTFTNPRKPIKHPHLEALHSLQRGTIGDLTASRKVRVLDLPVDEPGRMSPPGEPPPEQIANCLYLEWFSEANGRVVIESIDYELNISPPEWQLTTEENEERARQAAQGMNGFMQRLNEAIEKHRRGQKDPDEEEWDEHDYERFMKECDARNEKYGELLDKYGDSDDAEEKIADEMGWGPELTDEEAEEQDRRIEEINYDAQEAEDEPGAEPDPPGAGIGWIRTESGDLRHPLQHRCFESAMRLSHQVDELGLEESEDKDLSDLLSEFERTSVKLAGALNGLADGCPPPEGAFTVAYLKRALDHLHKAQAALEAIAPKKLLPEPIISEARKELFELREGILATMDEFRNR